MYVEDLDLCWRLDRTGWRRRLEADISITHVGNASGGQAWGESRFDRMIEASYDWYRFRRGRGQTYVWGAANLVGVTSHRLGRPARRAHLRGLLGSRTRLRPGGREPGPTTF